MSESSGFVDRRGVISGVALAAVSRQLGVAPATLKRWQASDPTEQPELWEVEVIDGGETLPKAQPADGRLMLGEAPLPDRCQPDCTGMTASMPLGMERNSCFHA